MAKPSPPIRCHFDGLIGSPLRIVAAESLEDLVVDADLRAGGLKLTTTNFILLLSTVDSWRSRPPRSDKAIDFDGLIGSRLQIVDAESLEDLVVHYYLRWGGLKLNRTYFILLLPNSHQRRRRKAFPHPMPFRWPYRIAITDRHRRPLRQ